MKLIKRKAQLGVGGNPITPLAGGNPITPLARRLVLKVLDSGRVSYGPFLERFEEKFAKLHGRRFAVTANSGTSALQIAVHALKELGGWRDGDEILVPALTFIATPNVILQNQMKPVFADVDPRTYHINPAEIEKRITKKTRAIMPVHLFGVSAEMKPIMAAAKKYKLRVIEDSCQAMGVKHRGQPVGSAGDIACFSTYAAHLITTGVGGSRSHGTEIPFPHCWL
ncbi:MAG: aminotransferase class V-fold PLP-dependent enzyme [Candidatus Sungbacteria bacterium]|uniref:Aminotransferase class V-fold PLP-dependent enzyme n=1 Tax=Candidatus Sungiibacteriota bacterium TaxID=2750080 RepID=A0A931SE52_9BACT|nr:aminotransferase class V-fold PLP-dependent enzyme [Candidatus Sungbacteria bacterium]